MQAFEIEGLLLEHERAGKLYHEFLHIPSLSVGIYKLPAGGTDPQQPHTEDEVYYIVSGHGSIRVGTEEREVCPGTVVLVEAGVEHRFHTIVEDMTILVFFAPAEYSLAQAANPKEKT